MPFTGLLSVGCLLAQKPYPKGPLPSAISSQAHPHEPPKSLPYEYIPQLEPPVNRDFRCFNEPHNLIFFGAPGTGKSHTLGELAKHFDEDHQRRVTFYPDYSYASFVGCYKPVMIEEPAHYGSGIEDDGRYSESDEPDCSRREATRMRVAYDFVPGPFLEIYISAVQNPNENFLLIIEEINRANAAAVFGDLFQLLDRDCDGRSEYEIAVPYDMRRLLRLRLPEYAHNGCIHDPKTLVSERIRLEGEANRLSLPPNLYLWATMNSADQGVFPMDTAFKRRWEFRYIGIDDGQDAEPIKGKVVHLGERREPVLWNDLRKAVNALLIKAGVNEDKLMGPFFLRPSVLDDDETFAEAFKSKVLLYLFEDAAKMRRGKVFSDKAGATYSEICTSFDRLGDEVFAMEPVKRAGEGGADEGAEA